MEFTIIANILIYSFAYFVIKKSGGLKKNLAFGFSIIIFTIYYFITPTYFYFAGRKTIWGDEAVYNHTGVDISDYYSISILYYGIANLFFVIGYIFINKRVVKNRKAKNPPVITFINPGKTAVQLFSIVFIIIVLNFALSGFDIGGLLKGDESQAIGGLPGFTNYIKNLADTLIILLVICFHYEIRKSTLILMTFLAFVLFGLLFFRYRIILTLVGFGFSYLYRVKTFKINLLKFSIFLVLFMYFILFFTNNRQPLVKAAWGEISFAIEDFDTEILFEQTRGMLDDINIIKYYEKINPYEVYDYGLTYLYVFVRILPRSLVGDEFKDNLYPPLSFKITQRAYDLPTSWGTLGEAPLHLAYNYIAGGLWGLFIFSFLSGFFLGIFQNRFPPINDYYIFINIGVSLALFQWYTRGYFPAFVDNLSFIIFGCWLLKKFSIKKIKQFAIN